MVGFAITPTNLVPTSTGDTMLSKKKKRSSLLPKDILVDLKQEKDVKKKVADQALRARGPHNLPGLSEVGMWEDGYSISSAVMEVSSAMQIVSSSLMSDYSSRFVLDYRNARRR